MAHPYFKNKLQKAPKPKQQLPSVGPSFHQSIPSNAVSMAGSSEGGVVHQVPGEVKRLSGPNKGRYLKLLYTKGGGRKLFPRTGEPNIKLKGGGEASHAAMSGGTINMQRWEPRRMPQKIYPLKVSGIVDARTQSHKKLTNSHDQMSLHHGIDFGRNEKLNVNSLTGDYAYMGTGTNHLGHKVIVKESLPQETLEEMGVFHPKFSSAHREALYHNMARDFFKMGHYVPTTSTFNHKGADYSSMMWAHKHVPEKHMNGSHQKVMNKLERDGELHKLGMMNIILGNSDRHGGNYLISNKGIKLIDHGLTFDYKNSSRHYKLGYLSHHNKAVPQHVRDWVKKMSAIQLAAIMKKNGAPQKITSQAVKNLLTIKRVLRDDPKANMNEVLTEANVDMD